MRVYLVLVILIFPIMCFGEDIESNIWKIECSKFENKKVSRIESCTINFEVPKLVKTKRVVCFGEIKVSTDGVIINRGYLQSFNFEKEISHTGSPIIVLPVMVEFPVLWNVTNVENNWGKCEINI
jgi:hypothetical protein